MYVCMLHIYVVIFLHTTLITLIGKLSIPYESAMEVSSFLIQGCYKVENAKLSCKVFS